MLLSVQYLRGLAASMVVFHHALVILDRHGSGDLIIKTNVGQAGVDMFFVISGFIMTYISSQKIKCLPENKVFTRKYIVIYDDRKRFQKNGNQLL